MVRNKSSILGDQRPSLPLTPPRFGWISQFVARTKSKPLSVVAGITILFVTLCAIFAPIVTPKDPYAIDPVHRLSPVGSPGYILGSDGFGRDELSRVIWGGRLSLLAGIIPAVAAMAIGVCLGVLSGYLGGWLDTALMALVDMLLAFPFMLLAIAFVAILGPSLQNAMLAVIIATVPRNVRLIRSQTLSIKEQLFIEAARSIGSSEFRIVFREILPNLLLTAVTIIALDITLMMGATAGLSFLGLGVQPPQADWGSMVADGKGYITTAYHITVVPSLMLAIVCVCFAILGDEYWAARYRVG